MASSAAVAADVARSSTPPPRVVTVAVVQFSCTQDAEENFHRAEIEIRDAARQGANVILVHELFANLYFLLHRMDLRQLAFVPDDEKTYILRFQTLARELNVVLPISFVERSNNAYFKSVVMIDSDGMELGIYRKSHISHGRGYAGNFCFSTGDTGFRTFKTRFAIIGIGICWDLWFPEAARCMALQNADLLLYTIAIGSEPQAPSIATCARWQRCLQGHAAANMIPVIAANRVGKEKSVPSDINFDGSSFMTDHTGEIVANAARDLDTTLLHTYNLDDLRAARRQWGIFRDRRPDLYTALLSSNVSAEDVANDSRRSPTLHSPIAPVPVIVEETPRARSGETLDLHEESFIGDIQAGAQRRPRRRCWACHAKTMYECKLCPSGPVPLCKRTARACWLEYHTREITPFVPRMSGRKCVETDHHDLQDGEHGEVEDIDEDMDANVKDGDQ